MSTDITEEKRGISRRDLIKKGAVAGAVFWSVPVIESITSRAAAGSLVLNCSWAIFVYHQVGTNTYFVNGFSGGGGVATPCGQGSEGKWAGTYATPASDVTVTWQPTEKGNNAQNYVKISKTNYQPIYIQLGGGSGTFAATNVLDTSCPGHISYLGNSTFQVDSGYEIVNYCAFQNNPPQDITTGLTSVTVDCSK